MFNLITSGQTSLFLSFLTNRRERIGPQDPLTCRNYEFGARHLNVLRTLIASMGLGPL